MHTYWWIRVVAMLIICIGVALTALNVGPVVEANLFPVLDQNVVGVRTDGQRLAFQLEGRKLRSCRLVSYGVGWRVDHSVITTSLDDVAGTPTTIPAEIQRERYSLGPYYVAIPDAARTYTSAVLKITYYYACSFLWLTEFDATIPLPQSAKAL